MLTTMVRMIIFSVLYQVYKLGWIVCATPEVQESTSHSDSEICDNLKNGDKLCWVGGNSCPAWGKRADLNSSWEVLCGESLVHQPDYRNSIQALYNKFRDKAALGYFTTDGPYESTPIANMLRMVYNTRIEIIAQNLAACMFEGKLRPMQTLLRFTPIKEIAPVRNFGFYMERFELAELFNVMRCEMAGTFLNTTYGLRDFVSKLPLLLANNSFSDMSTDFTNFRRPSVTHFGCSYLARRNTNTNETVGNAVCIYCQHTNEAISTAFKYGMCASGCAPENASWVFRIAKNNSMFDVPAPVFMRSGQRVLTFRNLCLVTTFQELVRNTFNTSENATTCPGPMLPIDAAIAGPSGPIFDPLDQFPTAEGDFNSLLLQLIGVTTALNVIFVTQLMMVMAKRQVPAEMPPPPPPTPPPTAAPTTPKPPPPPPPAPIPPPAPPAPPVRQAPTPRPTPPPTKKRRRNRNDPDILTY